MPIRMEDDRPGGGNSGNDHEGGSRGTRDASGGNGRGLLAGLLLLLPLLLRLFRGKTLMFLLIAGAALYFILGSDGCSGLDGLSGDGDSFTKGGFLDPDRFAQADIYEPLAADASRNDLPASASLQRFAPPVGDQGGQGSCVAWSSAYAARSILEATRTGKTGATFSPSFLYNQIGLEGCDGSYIIDAMKYMTRQGSVSYEKFPYDENDCSRQPDKRLIGMAGENRMRGFTRLSVGDRKDAVDIRAIKENIAQGAPVVIGMMVGESFTEDMMGKDLWKPRTGDRRMSGFGGHAMCVVGYDDRRYGGAFLIMNSWGRQWGNNGFAWVGYDDFSHYVREAYGLEPMGRPAEAEGAPLECEVGLVRVGTDGNTVVNKGRIALRKGGADLYATATPLEIGAKFKVEVRNNRECYIYVFGSETDGQAYTLFPYPRADDPTKSRYSPFCGITGYRLFPRDKSMTPDGEGRRDMVAVAVTTEPLDWYAVQRAMNSQRAGTPFRTRLLSAIGRKSPAGAALTATDRGTIGLKAVMRRDEALWCFVAIDKR